MKRYVLATMIFLGSSLSLGWTRPELPVRQSLKNATEASRSLDYMLVDVNGVRRLVRANDELTLLRGDKILIHEAFLKNTKERAKNIQVIGLMQTRRRGVDARGIEFRTRDLASRFSEGGHGQVYAILVKTKNEVHGLVYLKILEPSLRYAEVTINDQKRVLRSGELLKVSAKDVFHLDRIVTNIENDTDVLFQIVENSRGERAIRFVRNGTVFASIPLIIEE